MKLSCELRCVLLLLLQAFCGGVVCGAEALLIPEVVTREVSIHVGGVQTPEIQYVETREVSIFVGAEPDPPYREVATREVSVALSDSAPPPRVEDIAVMVSATVGG